MNPLYEPDFAATKMQELRRALKFARVGTGEIAEAIQSCTFGIQARGFTMLIVTCRRSGRWQKAAEIFDTMKAMGVKPNFYAYAALISVCCNAKACAKALEVFYDMVAASKVDENLHPPDALTYRALMLACRREGRHQTVVTLYRAMRNQGLNDDKQSMLCAMGTYVTLRQWRRALQVMDELHKLGIPIPLKDYLLIVTACADNGESGVATEVFLMLQMAGVSPSPQLCHQVIRASVSRNDALPALQLLEEMHKGDVECSLDSYECLLPFLAASGLWSDFVRVQNKMEAQGLVLGADASRVIIKHCAQAGESRLSHKLASKLKKTPPGNHTPRNQSPRWTIKAMKGRRSPSSPTPSAALKPSKSCRMIDDGHVSPSPRSPLPPHSPASVVKKSKVFKMMRDIPVVSYV